MDVGSTSESPTHLELTFVCGVNGDQWHLLCVGFPCPQHNQEIALPPSVSAFAFLCKHHEQKKLEEERVYFVLQAHHGGESAQELKART